MNFTALFYAPPSLFSFPMRLQKITDYDLTFLVASQTSNIPGIIQQVVAKFFASITPGYSVAVPAIRQRPLHFHPAAGFNVFDSGTLYPTLQLISEPDTGHTLPVLPYHPAYTRSLFLFLYSYPQSPSTSAARLPFIRASLLSREDLVPSLSRSLPRPFALSAVPSRARGTRPSRSSCRGTGLTPRLFQTHFNSLPGFAVAEWHADKCAVREHATTRCLESQNINMKIRARAFLPFPPLTLLHSSRSFVTALVFRAFACMRACDDFIKIYYRRGRFLLNTYHNFQIAAYRISNGKVLIIEKKLSQKLIALIN